MDMQEELRRIQQEAAGELEKIADKSGLEDIRLRMLGKKGQLTQLLRSMAKLPPEERPKAGQMINAVRQKLTEQMDELEASLRRKEQERALEREIIDITEPREHTHYGTKHPLSLIEDKMISIFTSMGFDVVEGPEVELDLFNFELLNIPKNHPARDAQDTFYIDPNTLLRTHTTAMQMRELEKAKGQLPIKLICPGKVYRRDDDDATHSPMFSQMEGLVVDRHITLSDLKGMLDVFAEKIFGEGTTTRLRPSYFPFTEPSVEVDVSCFACGGKGCSLCKGTGWIEVLGAGVVNRKVLANCGIDPEEYSGLAFGIGLERTAMLKYGIGNIKLLFESDVNVLNQIGDQT